MNIKRFTLLALSASVISVGAFVGFKKDIVAKYSPRNVKTFDEKARSYQGSLEYMTSIRANLKTGKIDYEEIAKAKKQISKNRLSSNKAMDLNWLFKGPDNIGGRTRAFIIDRNNPNTLYAGSVSGGLFVSYNQGGSWQSYSDDLENYAISSLVQTVNGDIYFGTGPIFDNNVPGGSIGNKDNGSVFLGEGLFKLTGNSQVQKIIGPASLNDPSQVWNQTTQLATDPVDPNILYATMDGGFRVTHDGGATWTSVSNLPTRFADDVDVASDGTVIVSYSRPGQIFKSTDKGLTFTESASVPFNVNAVNRVEYAIAPSDPNVHYASVAYNAGFVRGNCLYGVYQSIDKGATFTRIVNPSEDNFDYFYNGQRCQGAYDNAIAVYPDNPYKILLGGITLYRWEQTSFPPQQPNGSLMEIGNTFDFPGNPFYVHADKHNITFLDQNTVFVNTDGGVSRSTNINDANPGNITFTSLNYKYNVTQYYGMGVGPTGLLIGGTQDNGTNIVGFNFNNGKSGFEVIGGDGFDCDMSNLNPSIAFGSIYYGRIRRITGIGSTLGSSNINVASLYSSDSELSSKCGGLNAECGPFYTVQRLWESFYDETSKDSTNAIITVKRNEMLPIGSAVKYSSKTNELPLYYTTTQDYYGPTSIDTILTRETENGTVYDTLPMDTTYIVKTKDYVQSILAAANLDQNAGVTSVHITRDVLNASAIIDWIKVGGKGSVADNSSVSITGEILCMEFSTDGNHLFIGTKRNSPSIGGDLYRISGLNDVYVDADGVSADHLRKAVTRRIGAFGNGAVVGIAVDPNNANNLIATIGNYGHNTYVHRSTVGLTAQDIALTFQSIMGTGNTALPSAPTYDALIHYKDSNLVLVGNDFGVFATENAFDPDPNSVQWSEENMGMPGVGVYEIRQQTFGLNDSSKGITNTGEVYVATHARGMYQSTDLVGIKDFFNDKENTEEVFKNSLKIYPNPANNYSNFTFYLPESQSVIAKIFDIRGNLVRELNYGKAASGTTKIRMDVSELPTGTYIFQVITGKQSSSSKFIVQK